MVVESNCAFLTQKERDNESGLDYFLARYYSSAQGRFTSTDPVALTVERLTDPQRINLYAYARNNPLAFIDPTGEIITFANKEARERFEEYEKHLNEDKKKYVSELQTVIQLKASDVEYQLRTGGNFKEGTEANVTTDGNRILVGVSNVGGPQGEKASGGVRLEFVDICVPGWNVNEVSLTSRPWTIKKNRKETA